MPATLRHSRPAENIKEGRPADFCRTSAGLPTAVPLMKTNSHTCTKSVRKLSTLSPAIILHFPLFSNISPHYIHVIHTLLFLYHPYILQLLPSFSLYDPLNDGQAPIYPQSYPHYPQSPVCSLTHNIYPSCPQFYPQKQKQRASQIILWKL